MRVMTWRAVSISPYLVLLAEVVVPHRHRRTLLPLLDEAAQVEFESET
jgi:hypothetical protein